MRVPHQARSGMDLTASTSRPDTSYTSARAPLTQSTKQSSTCQKDDEKSETTSNAPTEITDLTPASSRCATPTESVSTAATAINTPASTTRANTPTPKEETAETTPFFYYHSDGNNTISATWSGGTNYGVRVGQVNSGSHGLHFSEGCRTHTLPPGTHDQVSLNSRSMSFGYGGWTSSNVASSGSINQNIGSNIASSSTQRFNNQSLSCRTFPDGASINECSLSSCSGRRLTINDCSFNGCDFSDSTVNDCRFNGSTLRGCRIVDCTFNGCTIRSGSMVDCTYNGSSIS